MRSIVIERNMFYGASRNTFEMVFSEMNTVVNEILRYISS